MRLTLAALAFWGALAQDPLRGPLDDLRSDDVAVRDAASRRLRILGGCAAPRLREALSAETDPEARARIADLLGTLLSVRAELEVRNPRLQIGERLDWSARLVNARDVPVVLARARRGSSMYLRLPLVDVELEGPDGGLRSGRDFRYDWTGRIEEVDAGLFVEVPPGGTFSPLDPEAERVIWLDGWRPERTGRHRIRFVYDTSPRRWGAWDEHAPPELQAQLDDAEPRAILHLARWPGFDVLGRFLLLHHERLVSPWVELEVRP